MGLSAFVRATFLIAIGIRFCIRINSNWKRATLFVTLKKRTFVCSFVFKNAKKQETKRRKRLTAEHFTVRFIFGVSKKRKFKNDLFSCVYDHMLQNLAITYTLLTVWCD